MSRSLVKLIVVSLLLAVVLVLVGVGIYVARRANWGADDLRRAGILWAYEALDETPADQRASRLGELGNALAHPLRLARHDEIEGALGHVPAPGEPAFRRNGLREISAYLTFRDGHGGLIIGPVDPVVPVGVRPVGLIFGLALLPLIAVLIGWRISRQLEKIDEASRALGAGNLGARVSNPTGPSSELAASFNDMAERLERLIRERDELIQAVSHELGSPLARLRFQLELLADSRNGQSSADTERLDAMAHQIEELDQLVEDLLHWVQSDRDAFHFESFDATGPLANLAELAQLEVPQTTSITVDVDAPTSVMLRADPRSYQRAVDNLLRNAVRYASTRVSLRLRLEDSSVVVSVEDDGPGIPQSERLRVVEPFIRVGPDRDRRTGGAGLGLAIVTRIMRAHGGELLIADSPLGGARLALYFPDAQGDTQPQGSDPIARTRSRSRRRRGAAAPR